MICQTGLVLVIDGTKIERLRAAGDNYWYDPYATDPNDMDEYELVVPDEITVIGESAFSYRTKMTKITF